MRTKHSAASVFTLAIAPVIVAGCLYLLNSFWLLTPFWAWFQLNQLRSEMALVPTVANTTLVNRVEGMAPSRIGGCAMVYIYELRGSNSLSLASIYHDFETALPPDVQRTKVTVPSGDSYDWKKGISIGLGSYATEQDFLPIDSARGEAAKQAYSTLIVIGLTEPVYPNGFEERCH